MRTWPFRPNWVASYNETYSFLTEIGESDSGREQRRALRVAARKSVDYQALVARDQTRLLMQNGVRHSDLQVFPDEVRYLRLTQPATLESDILTLSGQPSWLALAKHLVFEDGVTHERVGVDVQVANGAQVTLTAPITRAWPIGTRVFLGVPGRLIPSLTTTFHSNNVAVPSVEWMVDPGQEVQPVGFAPRMLAGREVLLHRPNWASPIEFEVSDPIQFVDPGMGVQAAFRHETMIPFSRRAQHLVASPQDLNATLGAFLRGRGRQGSFYQPTYTEDLPLMQQVNAGSTFWRTPGHGVYDAYHAHPSFRAFAVFLTNGDIHLFRVVQLSKSGTTTPFTIIQAAEAAPANITPASVAMICWMPVVRFASDDLSVRWRTDGVAEIVMTTLSIEDLL